MIIGGWQKFSLLDYPGQIAAIIFTKSCNFRCQFCYNPLLVWPSVKKDGSKLKIKKLPEKGKNEKDHLNHIQFSKQVKEDDLFCFLDKRKGKLDGIVITGGEPTIQADLPEFITKIKKLGYKVKLDTNGSHPEMLIKLLKAKLLDYIAMDIKGPREKYRKITNRKVDFNKIEKSVKIIMNSNLEYEFRTTIVPGLLNIDDIKKIGKLIKGAKKWWLQNFNSSVDLVNLNYKNKAAFSDEEMKEMQEIASQYVEKCEIR
ncbi:MAG: anaerobic ribonucleoside-triphosphate reductase activating protein [Patescibacteria group bacterium]